MKHNVAKKCLILLIIFILLSSLIRIPISHADVSTHTSSITGKIFTEYKQNDFGETNLTYGGTLDENGCALTMVANIANGYGKNITPSDVNKAYPSSFGIRVALKDYTGQDVQPLSELSEDTVIEKMKQGDVIWISWKAKTHQSAVVDLDEANKKVYVINSYRGDKLNGWQPISQVVSECEGSFIKTDGEVYASSTGSSSTSFANVSFNSAAHIIENDRHGYKIDLDLDAEVTQMLNEIDLEKSGISDFLSSKNRKEYLKDFIKAEIVTQYPDLRSAKEITEDRDYQKVKEQVENTVATFAENLECFGKISEDILSDDEIEDNPEKYGTYKTTVIEKGEIHKAEEYVNNRIKRISVQNKIIEMIKTNDISQKKVHEVLGSTINGDVSNKQDLIEKYYIAYIYKIIDELKLNVAGFEKYYLKDTQVEENKNTQNKNDELQGCIKVQRVSSTGEDENDNSTYFMSYIPSKEFEELINKYEASGDTSFKKYFTLDAAGNLVVGKAEYKNVFNVNTHENEIIYTAKKSNIDYLNQVSRYTMPFELIWTLLVYTQDEEFAHELANLAINSDIIISVYDNTEVTTATEVKKMNGYREREITLDYPTDDEGDKIKTTPPTENYAIEEVYYTTYSTNNAEVIISYADTWIATYTYAVTKKLDSTENNYKTEENNEVKEEDANKREEGAEELSAEEKKQILEELIKKIGITELKKDVIKYHINELDQAKYSEAKKQLQNNSKIQEIFIKKLIEPSDTEALSGQSGEILNELKNAGYNETEQLAVNSVISEMFQDLVTKYDFKNDETFKVQIPDSYLKSKNVKVTTKNWNDATQVEGNSNTTKTTYITTNGTVTPKIDKEAKKDNFVKLLCKNGKAKGNLSSIATWMFESIEANEYICDKLDLMKYLCGIAFGRDYGVDSFDFSIYDPRNFISINESSGVSGGVVEVLKSFENDPLRRYMKGDSGVSYSNVSEYVTEDRKQYKMYYTSFDGCLNFSYGIMVRTSGGALNNEGYFKDEGIDLASLVSKYNNGQEVLVDAEIVDRIQNKIVEDTKNKIREATSARGVNLKENEVDALVMVSYQYGNCGQYIEGSQNIAEVYKAYYQKGNVDGFKNNAVCQTGSGGLSHFFVTGKYPTREKYTWKLFNEGIYTLSDGTVITASTGGSIIDSAEKIHSYMEQNKYTYSLDVNRLAQTFEESKKYKVTCCATYVSWVLRDAGYINETIHGANTLASTLQSKYNFKRVNANELKAGDIMVKDGHVQIYAGNGQIYNAGYTGAIQCANPYKPNSSTDGYYGLRAPN